jgi:hypothetical protein
MKKVFQLVGVALVAVLTAQPAIAGLTCRITVPSRMACTPAMDMTMAQMGMSCPMHRHGAGSGCLQECCRNGWPPAVVRSAGKAKPRMGDTRLLLADVYPALGRATGFAIPPAEEIGAASPPRYILLQVFRI